MLDPLAATKGCVEWVCSDLDGGLSVQDSVFVFNPI